MDREPHRDRNPGNDPVVPSEGSGREAQDRPKGSGPKSPVDAMHVDAPKKRENESGHREQRAVEDRSDK